MNNQVSIMQSVQEKVRERIQSSFAELIPQEAWDEMIQQEMKSFVEKNVQSLVREAVGAWLREKIREELLKPEWGYDSGDWTKPMAGEYLKQVLAELTPQLVESMFRFQLQNAISYLRSSNL